MKYFFVFLLSFVLHGHIAYAISSGPGPTVTSLDTPFSIHLTGNEEQYDLVLFASNGRVMTGNGVGNIEGPFDYDAEYSAIGSPSTVSTMLYNWTEWEMPDGPMYYVAIPYGEEEECIANYDTASFENELGTSPSENLYQLCDALFDTLAVGSFGPPEESSIGNQVAGVPFTPVCQAEDIYVAIHYNEGNGVIDTEGDIVLSDSYEGDYPTAYNDAMVPCDNPFTIPYVGTFDYEFYTDQDINSNTSYGQFVTIAQEENRFSALIETSNTGFTNTLGFPLANAVTWGGSNVANPIMGTGLATLNYLKYWILALLGISIVIYFAYRAFRFYLS